MPHRPEPIDPMPRDPGYNRYRSVREPYVPQNDPDIERLRTVTKWLDDRYVDPIVGFLVPGGGDMITSAVGLYTLFIASKRQLPAATRARMLVNLALDGLIGSIPILGDLFDVYFKAHKRNLRLLERAPRKRSTAGDKAFMVLAAVLFLAAIALPILGVVWLAQTLF